MLRIKFEREQLGQSQVQVADAIGLPQPTYSLVERGLLKPTPTQLQRLVKLFNLPPDQLFTEVMVIREPEVVK